MAPPERFELPKPITLSGRLNDDVGYYFCHAPLTYTDPVTSEKVVPSDIKKALRPHVRL